MQHRGGMHVHNDDWLSHSKHGDTVSRREGLKFVMATGNWKTIGRHWLKFNAVGVLGTALQLTALAVLVMLIGKEHYLVATAVAVEMSIIHNFIWHMKWTWADRLSLDTGSVCAALLRFNLTAGGVSLLGNVVLMRV